MTDARSTYDDSNEVWPYFVLTVLGVVLIPVTISQIIELLRSAPKEKPTSSEHARFKKKQTQKRLISSRKVWFLIIGWVFMAWLISVVRAAGDTKTTPSSNIWDPYEILQVARSAGVKEIRSRYRKLSLEFHPDKLKDLVDDKKEEAEAFYVEISKAYRALTDEVTRENFLRYGHPDGPQPVTHGIALPVFLFNPIASATFIGAYMIIFMIGVPLVVSKWPSSQQKRTRKGLLQETATQFVELLAKDQAHFIIGERVLRTVLTSADMDAALNSDSNVEGKAETYEERKKLLDSYLNRNTPQTHAELVVAHESARLLLGMHDIAAEFNAFILCQRVLELRRAIIQAIPLNKITSAEYLQLKGAKLSESNATEKDTQTLLRTVVSARSYLPHLHLLKAQFRVPGEKNITTSSPVYLVLKFLVLPLGDLPPHLPEDEIDASDSIIDGTPRSKIEVQAGFRNPDTLNKKQPILGDTVAPYFPDSVQTAWYVYLYGVFDNKLAQKPLEVTNMDLHNLKLSREQVQDGDDILIGNLYIPIQSATPPTPGDIGLKLAMLSGSYFGADIRTSVSMKIVEPTELPEEEDDDDSDDDIEGPSDIDTSTEEEDNVDDEKKEETDSK